jgi:hypothetical protein
MADDFPTKSLERRMRCTRCEREGADVRSDYSQHGWRGNFKDMRAHDQEHRRTLS